MAGQRWKVARTSEVPERRCKRLRVEDEDIALWHVDGRWFAVSNVCSHQHIAALHQGTLRGLELTCPMHGWTYSLETGRATHGAGRIKRFDVRIEGEDVWLTVPSDKEEAVTATEKVKAKAAELGFSHVGVARALPLNDEGSRLREWMASGYEATMHWMARSADKRADPDLVLPGARSVLAVALNYYTPDRHPTDPELGKISRYAWGDDYHEVLGERLEHLRLWLLEAFPGSQAAAYCDTGPVMDKVWAQRAGIGWEGKHTNVITRDRGSWVFLGELLTTLELEPDPPAVDHCGTCTLCIEACPTEAIVAPYVLDANRCISYLTIEHRGDIDPSFADQMEGWIYGCDICQDVCPWNHRFSSPSAEPAFSARPGFVAPRLTEWENMTQEEFSATFRKSPVKRAKHAGLVRNVKLVLDGFRRKMRQTDPRGHPGASHT